MELIKLVAKNKTIFVKPHILSLFLNLFNIFNTTFKSNRVRYQFSLFPIKIYVACDIHFIKNYFDYIFRNKVSESIHSLSASVVC